MRSPTSVDIAAARRMHTAGWTSSGIARLLVRDGVQVSRFTVARWIDPLKAEQHRLQSRQAKRRTRIASTLFRMPGRMSSDYQEALARRLSEEGLTPTAIAIAYRVFFPDEEWDRNRIRSLLNRERKSL